MPNPFDTREGWLNGAVDEILRPLFAQHDAKIPDNIRISCSFPSIAGRSGLRRQRIGECWSETLSKDGYWEILISPVLDDPMQILDVVAHEGIHATVGLDVGHKGPFKRLALAIGLTGKMSATEGGPEFKRAVAPLLESLGPYPHGELDTRKGLPGSEGMRLSSGPRPQGTRLLKVMCRCGYTARVTQKWLDEAGPPLCPLPFHGAMQRQLNSRGPEL